MLHYFRVHLQGAKIDPGMLAAGGSMKRNIASPYRVQIGQNMTLKQPKYKINCQYLPSNVKQYNFSPFWSMHKQPSFVVLLSNTIVYSINRGEFCSGTTVILAETKFSY